MNGINNNDYANYSFKFPNNTKPSSSEGDSNVGEEKAAEYQRAENIARPIINSIRESEAELTNQTLSERVNTFDPPVKLVEEKNEEDDDDFSSSSFDEESDIGNTKLTNGITIVTTEQEIATDTNQSIKKNINVTEHNIEETEQNENKQETVQTLSLEADDKNLTSAAEVVIETKVSSPVKEMSVEECANIIDKHAHQMENVFIKQEGKHPSGTEYVNVKESLKKLINPRNAKDAKAIVDKFLAKNTFYKRDGEGYSKLTNEELESFKKHLELFVVNFIKDIEINKDTSKKEEQPPISKTHKAEISKVQTAEIKTKKIEKVETPIIDSAIKAYRTFEKASIEKMREELRKDAEYSQLLDLRFMQRQLGYIEQDMRKLELKTLDRHLDSYNKEIKSISLEEELKIMEEVKHDFLLAKNLSHTYKTIERNV